VPYGEPRGTVVAEPAYARDPFVRGYLGLGAAVGWLGGSTGVRSFGTSGGFDLHGGLEIGRWAAVELGWRFLATRDDVRERALLNAITLGAKAYLLPDGIVKPYVFGGVGVFVLSPLTAAHDAPVGPGLDLGIGADFNLSDHFALGARLSWRPAFLDEADLGLPTGSGVATLHDVSWTMRAQVRF
jgi:opacity protein-like surface antigen